MTLFELEIDEKSQAGSAFMARVVNEIRRAIVTEKKCRKITQQGIAEAVGTSRAVINRQVQGMENLSARRIAEILWAVGWEPHFEARPISKHLNDYAVPVPGAASGFVQPTSLPATGSFVPVIKSFENVGSRS